MTTVVATTQYQISYRVEHPNMPLFRNGVLSGLIKKVEIYI